MTVVGGRKKPSISQLEKRMSKERRGKDRGKGEKGYEMRLNPSGELTQRSMDQIIKEVKSMPYLTPYLVATKFGLKISRAKIILRELESKGVVKVVNRNRRVPIYVVAS